jgi:dihydrofolate reductase
MAYARVLLYIASSLDGFIARKDDDISWLDAYQVDGEDYGYSAFIRTIGTAVMGARTYAQSLEHPERLLKGPKTYVLSKRIFPIVSDTNVEFYSGTLQALIEKIKNENNKNIFIVGGGKVVSNFLNEGLIDEVMIFVVPILLKEGVSLYSELDKEIKLKLIEAIPYKSGIVQLHYALIKAAP